MVGTSEGGVEVQLEGRLGVRGGCEPKERSKGDDLTFLSSPCFLLLSLGSVSRSPKLVFGLTGAHSIMLRWCTDQEHVMSGGMCMWRFVALGLLRL